MTLAQLKGKRVAWVDPLSASGYVLPRIQLAARGLDPRILFKNERFYLSHEASVRAVVDRQADVAGTYARLDHDGSILRGSWSQVERAEGVITVIATFGAVPPDVTAARLDVDPALRDRVSRALIAMSFDEIGAPLVRDVFGVDEFRPWEPADYEALRVAMADAAARGLLDAGDATGQFPTQH
ncbi:MAG TPA: PhnD/SsuA/transferrin family substrate-binding protein [Caldimonas sp.]|nr:PhnD/SsuA/transferrin family substrate-binding protein [Caldimonas sp.]